MATALPPKRPPAPPPSKAAPPAAARERKELRLSRGVTQKHHKVVVYGPGGVGKTELCCLLQEVGVRPLILDLESGSRFHDVDRIEDLTTWEDLLHALRQDELLEPFDAIVVDSLTKAEELAAGWVLANIRNERNETMRSIEGYGFSKGLTFIYETFLQLLGQLDAVHRRGKHVICTAHECVSNVPNPSGEDWIRYEPRLQSPSSGKSSIRHRCKEWADHLIFVGYDQVVSKDGKADGAGTRTIYPVEMPTHWAKSRSLSDPIPYDRGSAQLWKQLFGRTEQ